MKNSSICLASLLQPWRKKLPTTVIPTFLMVVQSITLAAEPSIAYTVMPKDELIKMSAEFFNNPDDWKEVVQFNGIKNPDAIQPGQILKIPVRLLKPQPTAGRLVSTSGDVQLSGKKAEVGASVTEGDKLQTGTNSSAVLELADGSRVTLLPRTLTELVTSKGYALRAPTAHSTGNWFSGLLRLTTGTLETQASKTAKRITPLQIETPTSLVGVRGTQFRVAYDDPSVPNARTEVLEGLVRADNPIQGTGADLPQGKGTIFNPEVTTIKVADLLKAPNMSLVATDIFKPQALWNMPTLAGAVRYRTQVAGDKEFNQIVRDMVVTTGRADLSDLPNGMWYARVRGIDAEGLEGYDSVKAIQMLLPATPTQAPRQWRVSQDRLDVRNGQHILQFGAFGLESSHTILATVKLDQPPYTRIAKSITKGGSGPVVIDLGTLASGEKFLLNLTVTQDDGATLSPSDYQFEGLGEAGQATAPLQPVRPKKP